LELECQGFHVVSSSLPHITPTLIKKIKALTSFKCKYQIILTTLLVFVDASEDLIMVDDATTLSNPPIAPIEEEEVEEAPFDMNVSQWLCKKEPSRRVVCIQINHSTWDHRLFPNPHALTIYLEFVHVGGIAPKRFEKCKCQDDDVHLHCRT